MDEFLTKEYSPSQWSKRYGPTEIIEVHDQVLKSKSKLAYETINNYSHKLSDNSKEECLEIFYKNLDSFNVKDGLLNFNGRKIFIYLHGGYWQWGSVFASSFMAENFVSKDVVLVACGYDLAPNVTITEIINQVKRGVSEVLKYSADSEIYLCGHSAGAHLAACLIHSDLNKMENIHGFFLVAGVYDLTPLLKTDVNDNVKMNMQEATDASPIFKTEVYFTENDKKNVQILLVYGENESNEFKRQSHNYSQHLKTDLGFINVICEQIETCDHFDLIENISIDSFSLTKKIYQIMNIH